MEVVGNYLSIVLNFLNAVLDFLDIDPSKFLLSQWLFLRLLGLNYLVAFLSMTIGVKGLWGENGILSIKTYLQNIQKRHPGWIRFYYFPSVFWINSSDIALVAMVWLPLIASIMLILNIATVPMLIFLWVAWTSFICVDTAFMRRQSDSLLVEVGFFSIFYAMITPPPLFALLYIWFLLFKFMFMAGMAKILSGDPSWRDGSAMSYHYETQPLPNWISWYAHKMPMWVHKISSFTMFIIEIVAPFFILCPEPVRFSLFVLFALLQVGIFTTGNFTFINVLSFVLASVLIEDRYLEGWIWPYVSVNPQDPHFLTLILVGVVCSVLFIMSSILLFMVVTRKRANIPIMGKMMHFHICNSYGLFAVMTKYRNEVIIEGSEDGKIWKEYEFKWKAGDVYRPTRQMAPHHPRLDWQMWFASLGNYKSYPWFSNLIVRLLQGSEDVLALLKKNPFPDGPPTYIRSKLYRYHFADLKTRKKTGSWWIREFLSDYTPVFSREKQASPKTRSPANRVGSSISFTQRPKK
ncbi:MAG: hypothetical protein ACI9S8_000523 [Chlamydiales bacterium]|jgi:hypothetical protein